MNDISKSGIITIGIFLLILTMIITPVSAVNVGQYNGNPQVVITPQTVINYSIISTNQSNFWGNYLYSDYDMPAILADVGVCTNTSYYLESNPYSFYNSTNPPPWNCTNTSYVKKSGDTMTGSLLINTSTINGGIMLIGNDSSANFYNFLAFYNPPANKAWSLINYNSSKFDFEYANSTSSYYPLSIYPTGLSTQINASNITAGTFTAGNYIIQSSGSNVNDTPLIIQNSMITGTDNGSTQLILERGTSTNRSAQIWAIDDSPWYWANAVGMAFLTGTNGQYPSERMRLTSSGSLGIGTTLPKNVLNVIGDINATTTVYSQNKNLSLGYDYALNGTGTTTWANVVNGTMASWGQVTNGTVGSFLTNKVLSNVANVTGAQPPFTNNSARLNNTVYNETADGFVYGSISMNITAPANSYWVIKCSVDSANPPTTIVQTVAASYNTGTGLGNSDGAIFFPVPVGNRWRCLSTAFGGGTGHTLYLNWVKA